MKRRGLVQRSSQTNFVKSVEEIIYTDAALRAAVPLLEDSMQIGSRGVFATQCSPDIHNSLFIDGFLKGQRLIRSLLLPPPDCFF